ncbi:hypothetical protein ACFL5G_01540 [Candidatus Margulisiibacteriota bacterium]
MSELRPIHIDVGDNVGQDIRINLDKPAEKSVEVKFIEDALINLRNEQDPQQRISYLENVSDKYQAILEEIRVAKLAKKNLTELISKKEAARKLIKEHFKLEIKNQGIDTESFSGLEKYYNEHVSDQEFFCSIYLYTQSNFDVSNQNKIIKSPKDVFNSKQGECDDISYFVDHFATLRGITDGQIIFQDYFETDKDGVTGHVAYMYDNGEKITVLDQYEYVSLDKDDYKLRDYRDIIYKYCKKIEKANPCKKNLSKAGNLPEKMLYDGLKLTDYEYKRSKHFLK